jgi:nucleoside triphosphatase
MQEFPEVAVGGLVINNKGEIFLMKSHKWKGKYTIPGGHIETGESAEEALKREVKEETSLEVYDIRFISYQDFIFDEAYWKKKHFIFLDFSCRTNYYEARLNDEAQEYIWVNAEQALKMDIEPYSKRTIEEYLKKNKLSSL